MTDALFDNSKSYNIRLADLAALFSFGDLKFRFINCQKVSMHGCLRYKTIWKGKANNATDESCAAEKEEVPVEINGLL
jgi:hypothetical protein